jgi:hypothetical protein
MDSLYRFDTSLVKFLLIKEENTSNLRFLKKYYVDLLAEKKMLTSRLIDSSHELDKFRVQKLKHEFSESKYEKNNKI